MRGLWLALCDIAHHRRVDGTNMTVMLCLCSSAAIAAGQPGDRAVDDQLIQLCDGGPRNRLLTLRRAGEADGAAHEMEQRLGGLLWMSSSVTERGTRRHRRVTG